MVNAFHPSGLRGHSIDHDKTPHSMIDQAIFEAEKEVEEGGKPIALDAAIESLDGKHYGMDESAKPEKKVHYVQSLKPFKGNK